MRNHRWNLNSYQRPLLLWLLPSLILTSPAGISFAPVAQAQVTLEDEMAEGMRVLQLILRVNQVERLRDQLYAVIPLQGQNIDNAVPFYQAHAQMVDNLRRIFLRSGDIQRKIAGEMATRGAQPVRSQLYPGIFDDLRDLASTTARDGRSLEDIEVGLRVLTTQLGTIRQAATGLPALLERLQSETLTSYTPTTPAWQEAQGHLQRLEGLMGEIGQALATLEQSSQQLTEIQTTSITQVGGLESLSAEDLYTYRTRLQNEGNAENAGVSRFDKEVLRREGKDNDEGYQAFYHRSRTQLERLQHQGLLYKSSQDPSQNTFAWESQELPKILRLLQQAWESLAHSYPLRAAAVISTTPPGPTPPPDGAGDAILAEAANPASQAQPWDTPETYLSGMLTTFKQGADYSYAHAVEAAVQPSNLFMTQILREGGAPLIASIERAVRHEPAAKPRINALLLQITEALEKLKSARGADYLQVYPQLDKALERMQRISDHFPNAIALDTPLEINYVLQNLTADLQRINQTAARPSAAVAATSTNPGGAPPHDIWRPALRAARTILEKTTTRSGIELPYLRVALAENLDRDENEVQRLIRNVTALAKQVVEIDEKFPGLLPEGTQEEAETLHFLCATPATRFTASSHS